MREDQWRAISEVFDAASKLKSADGFFEQATAVKKLGDSLSELKDTLKGSNFFKDLATSMAFHVMEQFTKETQTGRTKELFLCALQCARILNDGAEDAAVQLKHVVEGTGGYVRKLAQQVSQSEAIVKRRDIREEFKSLQSSVPPRSLEELHVQLRSCGCQMQIERVLGTGCMADVVLCNHPEHGLVAAKLPNLKEKKLFEADLEFFSNLEDNLRLLLRAVQSFKPKEYDELKLIVEKVQDMVRRPEVHGSMVNAFDVSSEASFMEIGSDICEGTAFVVPKVVHCSKQALLMQFLAGTLLQDASAHSDRHDLTSFWKEFLVVVVRMVRRGFVHRDMHPGNLMINPNVIIDWGEVVQLDCEESTRLRFFQYANDDSHVGDSEIVDVLRRLGVRRKEGVSCSSTDYRHVLHSFSIVRMLGGDPAPDEVAAQMVGASKFSQPAWMDLLQSALMAISISFRYCGADARDVQHEFSMQLGV